MSAQEKLEALTALCGKLTEIESAKKEFIESEQQLVTQLESHRGALERMANSTCAGIPSKDIYEALYAVFKPCPGAFSQIAAQAERLSSLMKELNTIIFEKFLRE
jgi:hypothetical protein